MTNKIALYEQGKLSIIDLINNKTGRGIYSNETIEEVRLRYPQAELIPFDKAIECISETTKEVFPMLQPIEISKDKYFEMLECLPPFHWKTTAEGSSFKMSEMTFNDITVCYVSKNNKYYEMYGKLKTTHEELLASCK